MNTKKLKLPIIIIAIGLALAIASCFLTCILKEPTTKTHDFAYSVTYKLNGEEKTFEGVYKCSFDGYEYPTCRIYEGKLFHNGEELDSGVINIAQKDGVELYIVAEVDAAYLMGDPNIYEYGGNEEPYLEAIDSDGVGVDFSEFFDAEIISWEYPESIENSLKFKGFSVLHAGSMMAMLAIAVLTIIACAVFVKKGSDVSYSMLDKVSVVFNFIIGLIVIPFFTLVIFIFPLAMNEESIMYQIYLCIPAISTFAIAASVALRRKGYEKSGLITQFVCPALFIVHLLAESLIYNLFM